MRVKTEQAAEKERALWREVRQLLSEEVAQDAKH